MKKFYGLVILALTLTKAYGFDYTNCNRVFTFINRDKDNYTFCVHFVASSSVNPSFHLIKKTEKNELDFELSKIETNSNNPEANFISVTPDVDSKVDLNDVLIIPTCDGCA